MHPAAVGLVQDARGGGLDRHRKTDGGGMGRRLVRGQRDAADRGRDAQILQQGKTIRLGKGPHPRLNLGQPREPGGQRSFGQPLRRIVGPAAEIAALHGRAKAHQHGPESADHRNPGCAHLGGEAGIGGRTQSVAERIGQMLPPWHPLGHGDRGRHARRVVGAEEFMH